MLIITLFSVSFISLIHYPNSFFYLNVFPRFLLSLVLFLPLIVHLHFLNLLHQSTKSFHYYFRFLTLVLSLQILLLHIYFIDSPIFILNPKESALGLDLFRNHITRCSHLILKFLTCFFLIDYFYKIYLFLKPHLHRYLIQNEIFWFSTENFISLFDFILFNQFKMVAKVLI